MTILTVEDVRQHLNLTLTDDDALIASKIAAAEAWVGSFLGAPLAGPVPEPVKEAVRQLVASLYENREANAVGVNVGNLDPGFFDLLAPYREWSF